MDNQPIPSPGKNKSESLLSVIITGVICLAIICVFLFVIAIVPIQGSSMQPLIVTSDTAYCVIIRDSKIANGNVIVFAHPEKQDANLIKRVIATENQTVSMSYTDGTVELRVDGELLAESYIAEEMVWAHFMGSGTNSLYRAYGVNENLIEFTVPEGKFLAMGDNRNVSLDSRYYGLFDTDTVLGKVFFVWDDNGPNFI